jgi:glyoxylate reductase
MTPTEARWPVLVTRRVPPRVLEAMRAALDVDLWDSDDAIPREELLRRIAGKRAAVTLLTERVDAELLDAAPELRIVANYAVGFDNIDVKACTTRGILATNTPDVLTETTADLAWALILAASRRITEGDRFLRTRTPWIWGPQMMLGRDVHGATLGLVGFGRIGQAVARRGLGFGMTIVYADPRPAPPETERELHAERVELDELLSSSDVVSIHVALMPETHHLFDAEAFRKMKETAVLVNTSRGPVIDEEALVRALRDGEIFAAGLDVFEREPEVHPGLLETDNAVILPHLGSASVGTRDAMGLLALENVVAAMRGERPPTLIDPGAWERRRRESSGGAHEGGGS